LHITARRSGDPRDWADGSPASRLEEPGTEDAERLGLAIVLGTQSLVD
jgi:hypothetical protein